MDDETNKSEQNYVLHNILNKLPSMVGYWDANLKNKFSNAAYLKYFNMTSEEIYNKHIRDVIGEELFQKNYPYIEGALAGKNQFFERAIPLKSGEIRYTQAEYISDIRDGKVHGFFVLVTDVSELKKIEKEKEEIYQKLIQSSKMVALGEMAGGVAHEINNPLVIIEMNAVMASNLISSDNFGKNKLEKFISTIRTTSNRIAKIVTGLQFFSQERPNDPFEKHSILGILNETTSFCMEKLKARKINFIQKEIDESLTIDCRPTQVSQVILNLLNNAADAVEGSEDKWISVSVNDKGKYIEIAIVDSGKGIAQEISDKLMQPFITTKEIGKGTGLGLSISKGIVENHGGKLTLERSAKNTTFLVTLPKFHN